MKLRSAAIAAFAFNLQLFDIAGTGGNGFPQQMLNVMQQKGYLETKIRKAIEPTLVMRPKAIGALDWFEARIGETKSFSRQAFIAPSTIPLNPANNTGLDNGMTADTRSYEQWIATLNEYPGFIPTNILGQEAFLGDLYIDNMVAMAQKANNSLEMLCVTSAFIAYQSGDTFASAAATATGSSVHIDNGFGFDTQYPTVNLPLYQVPVVTGTANKIPTAIISGTTGNITGLANTQAWTPDVSNASSMISGNQSFGISGAITLDANVAPVVKGDRVVTLDTSAALSLQPPTIGAPLNPVWKDGPQVVRPLDATSGNQIQTSFAMTAVNRMNPSVMIPAAVAILKRRGAPKLPNGLYGCAIDSTLLASFYGDTGFQRATATNFDRGRYFTDGIIAAGWGVEFTEATQLPVFNAPAGGFSLRHAFVFGLDMITEHPFAGARNASNIVAGVGDVADERWENRIKFRTTAAIDTLGQVIKIAYDYVGAFVCGTDKASNPNIVGTSDYSRYKRGVVVQAASPY